MAVDQAAWLVQTHRFREQARSHIWIEVGAEILGNRTVSVGAGLPAMAVGQAA